MKVTVIGSINMDVVNNVVKHPLPGETIKGKSTTYNPGGKGANQAVAAAQAGVSVNMIGAVGNDAFGPDLVASLQGYGIEHHYVQRKNSTSGLAFITVDEKGENTIILSEGANGRLSRSDIDGALGDIATSNVVLLQNEIPWDTTVYAMTIAKQNHVKVILNPAPARPLDEATFSLIDVLVMNETETEEIFGNAVNSVHDAVVTAKKIVEQGVKSVIITLGDKGSVYVDGCQSIHTPAYSVDVVDTTAAGDTFIGAFSTRDIDKVGITKALQFASAASAIAVTRHGAQSSIPTQEEIEMWMEGK